MVFNSFAFLVFFPVVLLLYAVLPKRFRYLMLLAASYFFYAYSDASLVLLILFTTAVSYFGALAIAGEREKHGNDVKTPKQKLWLIITLVVSLGTLFFFKYFNFLSESVHSLVGVFSDTQKDPLVLNLLLPVGISFYTFQTLSYVIDVYRGTVGAERHFGYYALYVSFFPQLVAGPIERPENLLPQLKKDYKLCWEDTVPGLRTMLIGYFKKVVVADQVASYVNRVYNQPEGANGLAILIATVLFAVQIYCDFSGYTDIAIGSARIMGVKLRKNFDHPYSATSIRDFWRRWHISLSEWFRDYVFIPLGGSRVALPKHLVNLLIVFFLSGLWHGAAWTFVLWGLLHGVYQVIGILLKKPRQKAAKALGLSARPRLQAVLSVCLTFTLVCFGWIFFRANSISDLGTLLSGLFTKWDLSLAGLKSTFSMMEMDITGAITTIASVILLIRLDAKGFSMKNRFLRGLSYVLICWCILIAWFLLLKGDGASSFIYFRF